jgi:N-acetylated-alpha-linked acidic dipeptidase
LNSGALDAAARGAIDERLIGVSRHWTSADGLPERPWFRNLFAATDEDSGYASWPLPGLRKAVEAGDRALYKKYLDVYAGVLKSLDADLDRIEATLPALPK